MKTVVPLGLLGIATLTTGCASIVTGTNQSVSVETHRRGMPITDARCKLTNDKGTWFVTTPGSVTVNRSYDDLAVHCKKMGVGPGSTLARSTTKGMAFGNILIGGLIGTGVDIGTGAAYDYPSLIQVDMAESIIPSPDQSPTSISASAVKGSPSVVPQPPSNAVAQQASTGRSSGYSLVCRNGLCEMGLNQDTVK